MNKIDAEAGLEEITCWPKFNGEWRREAFGIGVILWAEGRQFLTRESYIRWKPL